MIAAYIATAPEDIRNLAATHERILQPPNCPPALFIDISKPERIRTPPLFRVGDLLPGVDAVVQGIANLRRERYQ